MVDLALGARVNSNTKHCTGISIYSDTAYSNMAGSLYLPKGISMKRTSLYKPTAAAATTATGAIINQMRPPRCVHDFVGLSFPFPSYQFAGDLKASEQSHLSKWNCASSLVSLPASLLALFVDGDSAASDSSIVMASYIYRDRLKSVHQVW